MKLKCTAASDSANLFAQLRMEYEVVRRVRRAQENAQKFIYMCVFVGCCIVYGEGKGRKGKSEEHEKVILAIDCV